jgi:hypothetical protein
MFANEMGTNELLDLIYDSLKKTKEAFAMLKQSERKKKDAWYVYVKMDISACLLFDSLDTY